MKRNLLNRGYRDYWRGGRKAVYRLFKILWKIGKFECEGKLIGQSWTMFTRYWMEVTIVNIMACMALHYGVDFIDAAIRSVIDRFQSSMYFMPRNRRMVQDRDWYALTAKMICTRWHGKRRERSCGGILASGYKRMNNAIASCNMRRIRT